MALSFRHVQRLPCSTPAWCQKVSRRCLRSCGVVRDLRETACPRHRLPCSRDVEPREDLALGDAVLEPARISSIVSMSHAGAAPSATCSSWSRSGETQPATGDVDVGPAQRTRLADAQPALLDRDEEQPPARSSFSTIARKCSSEGGFASSVMPWELHPRIAGRVWLKPDEVEHELEDVEALRHGPGLRASACTATHSATSAVVSSAGRDPRTSRRSCEGASDTSCGCSRRRRCGEAQSARRRLQAHVAHGQRSERARERLRRIPPAPAAPDGLSRSFASRSVRSSRHGRGRSPALCPDHEVASLAGLGHAGDDVWALAIAGLLGGLTDQRSPERLPSAPRHSLEGTWEGIENGRGERRAVA